jgi:hypothetical protein
MIIEGNSALSVYRPFRAMKHNLAASFKDGRVVETVVTIWLITEDTNLYQWGIAKLVP